MRSEEELRFSHQRGFFDQSAVVRLLIGLFFVCSLFFFLHNREVRIDVLELGTVAPKYIVAQENFVFPDEEATIVLRQESTRDIGQLYKLSDNQITAVRREFEKRLVDNQDWRRLTEKASFVDFDKALDLLESTLTKVHFADARTLQKMKDTSIENSLYFFYPAINAQDDVILDDAIWQVIFKEAFEEAAVDREIVFYLKQYFEPISWKVEEDEYAERAIRQAVQQMIPQKFTSVVAGKRIIDQGEVVSQRHMSMLQSMKQAIGESRNLWHPMTVLGSLMMALLFAGLGVAYLRAYHRELYHSNKRLFLLISVIVLTLLIAKATEAVLMRNTANLLELIRYPIFVPFAAILLTCLLSPRVAAAAVGFLTVVLTLSLSIDHNGFLVINLVTAVVCILNMGHLRKRKEIFFVCGKAWGSSILVLIALNLYEKGELGWPLISDITSAGAFMALTAIIVVGLLPIFEAVFRIMTDISLMEFMDPSNEILQRLMLEAPGTYQHSVVVGNLSETAALAIGANGLFCRVSAQYHDIGKLVNPQYFTENQTGGMNVHQLLTPLESAQVIISHVSEGVSMGRKIGLPEQFIDIIKEHHGMSLVYYFYHKQVEMMGGDRLKVQEKDFRYSGPKPRSKESAIIMIADTVDAASRSLDELNEENVENLVEQLIKEKEEDGQFDHCLLTFEELGIVKRTIVKSLVSSAHARVKYPERLSD